METILNYIGVNLDEVEYDEVECCHIFLNATDHIPNKIIESQALGKTPKDYTDVLELRQYARDKINGLR